MTKTADLQKQLSKALPRVRTSRKHSQTERAATSDEPKGVQKLSVSLYQPDLRRLDEIKEYMRTQGIRRVTDSMALRLACRRSPVDGELLTIYHEMRQEDGRARES